MAAGTGDLETPLYGLASALGGMPAAKGARLRLRSKRGSRAVTAEVAL
jgi:hypothetical protein